MSNAESISLKKRSSREIHNEAVSVARNIKTHYLKLFEILLVVEAENVYYDFDIPSLHTYCIELLELSRHVANDFVTVVRKSLEIPKLKEAIYERKITISKARKICSVIDNSNAKDWIDLAESRSCRVVEKAVAMVNPRDAVPESLKYVSGDVLELKMAVSEDWAELLKNTKDLLSQQLRRAVSSEEALFILMGDYNKKNDPVEKAKRAQKRAQERPLVSSGERLNPQAPITASRKRSLPAASEHAVHLRDENQCTHIDKKGRRCVERRWLQIRHNHEFANGGDHDPENLRTLCFGHHKIKHLKNSSRD